MKYIKASLLLLFLLFSAVRSETQESQDCGVERIDNVYYPVDQNFDCYLSNASEPFLINFCDENPECNNVKERLTRLAKESEGKLKVSISYQKGSLKMMRRLSVPLYPTFFYSEDAEHFIIYYWPREYEDLLTFVTGGYKNVPKYSTRYLDPESLHVYLYQSFFYLVGRAGDRIDGAMSSVGFGWLSGVVKIGLAVGIVGGISLLILMELYRCHQEQRKLSTIWLKKKA